ncbi:PHP-associated domain-containing protein [Haloprofundus sp. MHR1]|uniref:PHP-associated domain-containing protein n=1 Tax=Haloprofundus sp. MHR1 TaxID=2572921 RepID=UPI0010BE2F0A|nr:PHP-associated domain-containing protein [Haloprofundus sp. MHR1]QCJ46314.1 PHP domain-containing protein [Haloprofundus sp. MHR1]
MFSVDLHSHSRFFHGWRGRATRYDPLGLRLHAVFARLRGLDGFAVTNHDYTYSAEGSFPTIPGNEVTTTEGHVLVVGPNPPSRTEPNALTPGELVDLAHDRGCATILAHPFRNSSARDSGAEFDAVELNGKNTEHIARTRRLAEELDLPLVGGSDAHYPIEVGRAYTEIDAPDLSPESVAAAIRDGRVEPVVKLSPLDKLLAEAYSRIHAHKKWLDPADRTPTATSGKSDD